MEFLKEDVFPDPSQCSIFTNSTVIAVTTYVTALNISGRGILLSVATAPAGQSSIVNCTVKITIDGSVIYENYLSFGKDGMPQTPLFAFETSLLVEMKCSANNSGVITTSYLLD